MREDLVAVQPRRAATTYGSVYRRPGRWIEVASGSRRVMIDDFCWVKAGGEVPWKVRHGNAHRSRVAAFRWAAGDVGRHCWAAWPPRPKRGPVAMTDRTADSATEVRQLFGAKALTWSAKYAAGGRLTGRLVQLGNAVESQTTLGCRVLDLGCGTGDLAGRLARAGLQVTGCDFSKEMLEHAARADPTATVAWVHLTPDWRTLPFPAGTFGAIVASSVLEYVDDPVMVLRECGRVLRPGGVLLFTVPDLRHPSRWLEWSVALAAKTSAGQALGRRQSRLQSYMTYLRVSRQRHTARWWHDAARAAAMHSADSQQDQPQLMPLRLHTFRQSCEPQGVR